MSDNSRTRYALLILGVIAFALVWDSARPRKISEQKAAAYNLMKGVAIGVESYCLDYDDVIPYVQDSNSFAAIILPYVRSVYWMLTEHKGRRELGVFNLQLAGVKSREFEDPSAVPVFWEAFEYLGTWRGDWPTHRRRRWMGTMYSRPLVVYSDAEFARILAKAKYPSRRYGKPLPLSIGAEFKYEMARSGMVSP